MSDLTVQEEFRAMAMRHDLTHNYSDDGGVWRRGAAELGRCKAYAAANLTRAEAVQIWNEVVAIKMQPDSCKLFEWKL